MADSEVVQLSRAEKPWKPRRHRSRDEEEGMDPVERQTQTILRHVRSVLNKLTPQMFQPLMRKMCKISICSERHLVAVVDLLFEKAISEPQFSVAYASMSRCLMGEQQHHLKDSEKEVRQRMVGNAKFIGELFKLKMLTEPIIHDCIVNLLKTASEESLECACVLLSTAGKDLDFEKAKPRMDHYFNKIETIICERKTSNKMRFMLQDVIDLRQANWISRCGDCGPKTIDQIHKEAMKGNVSQFKKSFPAFSHGSKSGDMDLFWRVHCIVNELTPQTFSPLMKQLSEMPINSEARLKGLIDMVFERALFVPKLSTTYANVCRCLAGLKVPKEDNWRVTMNFRKLLLNRCQKEFEDGCHETGKEEQDDSGAQSEEEEQEEIRAVGPRRSLGNIKFICELFKVKILNEVVIHDCIVKLINSSQEESLCLLLLIVGKDLDDEKAKPRMDQYFNQMKKIIQEKNISPIIQCLLQGVIDLRERCWVPNHSDPTADSIIDQICQDSVKKVKSASNNPQNILDVKPQSTDICTEELPKTEAYTEGLPKITVAYTEDLPKNTETDTDELTKTTEAYTGDTITEELVRVGGLKQVIED